jgi:hypothetical protein
MSRGKCDVPVAFWSYFGDVEPGKGMALSDPETTPKFFLHWFWRMTAQLGLSNVWLASRNLAEPHGEADAFLESALSTADPRLGYEVAEWIFILFVSSVFRSGLVERPDQPLRDYEIHSVERWKSR